MHKHRSRSSKNLPGEQELIVVALGPGHAKPAGQLVQFIDCAEEENQPEEHAEQLTCSPMENQPAPHDSGAELTEGQAEPGGHEIHVVAFATST